VRWAELPGFAEDNLFEAWNAWIKNCERPGPALAALCTEVRQLSIADGDAQRQWMVARLQPYRVETPDGRAEGLLTSYYEPLLAASRVRTAEYAVPLYARPPGWAAASPGTPGRRSTRCRRRRRRCRAARSPGWPARSMR